MEKKNIMQGIAENIGKVMVGQSGAAKLMVVCLAAGGHVLIEDVPGIGKTTMANALAKSIGVSFNRIQFTPDILPSDITGFSMYNPKTGEFEYKQGSIMSNIILADEINRTSPKTQASMLEVMEERHVTVDGVTYSVPEPFMVIATQNPVEYMGTYPLPEAQLDRFLMRITMGYPSSEDEVDILYRFKNENPLNNLEPVADGEQVKELQRQVRDVHVDRSVGEYIVEIVQSTRRVEHVALGCSPRASLYLMRAAQALALYNGRDYVIPDDVKSLVIPVLAHRMVLKQEAKIRKLTAESILSDLLKDVRVPV
ncbi:ATPase associated with various cellular activities AAA_3 [Thermoclostridium stercorarium subsp. stercorarium DSM 8532]|uniref:ATPase associated with various cellular activities AAA_3 n=4 Tax=Thermoclostridium stercorarium TaxID=1510 RepID=L7VK31_THES1|nr:MoxR family ATPase [Thermoclostridium stercorarium]AGC68490.1 ATPase associated with various cellular activities AAA_3 [Thermoclostridium stercorarium subsp. stercorarium DSM 8532]AGI39508.1 ATPase [Thermoclostridium stercorarium subsp. stercorarium DSM 8532]ANW98851.1 magnesium chelatase [Thermoclostridium stercorarium subsp. thermolacticum DSM 2910]ANX01376.1 magnesium chelatase [Thermoclostridium stercorarium subsp. leptospartum DSM 9219]